MQLSNDGPDNKEKMPGQDNPNRARDHLANERTYLAWIRTAVAFLGIGIVIVRLRYLLPSTGGGQGWQLGLIFGIVGLFLVVLATMHYFHVQNAIESNSYEPEKRWIIACSIILTLVGSGVIYYLFTSSSMLPTIHNSIMPLVSE